MNKMSRVNRYGYLCLRGRSHFIVRARGTTKSGYVPLNIISLPAEFVGQRIRIKVEVIKDD